jgi:hypothetical protein
MSTEAIIRGILNVAAANESQRYATPEGRYPCCKNSVGTWACERCGSDVREMFDKPCPSIPPEQRWDMRYSVNAE